MYVSEPPKPINLPHHHHHPVVVFIDALVAYLNYWVTTHLQAYHTCTHIFPFASTDSRDFFLLDVCMRQPPQIIVSESTGCPKCGFIKKSKISSCCARGGAWYNNCGNEGDSKFGHTWAEGVRVCKGTLTACWIGICEG